MHGDPEKQGPLSMFENPDSSIHSLRLPTGLHPDDATTVFSLLRIAEGRPGGFGTTILARVEGADGNPDRQVCIVVLGNERGATTLIGDADDELILDSLTGLPGREYLLEMLEGAIQDTTNGNHSVAVYSIDIDRFKSVNDTRGFIAGDDALRFLATKLEDALRPDDILTRFGGDEFTIVCPHALGVAEATALGERFRATCIDAGTDSPLNGLTVSVGIAIGRADRNAEDLVREAETARCQAKELGRDRCELFDDELRTRSERRNTVDLATERTVGCEAPLRIAGGDNPIFVSVNVSDQRVLDNRFPLTLARTLHNADLPSEQVHLELHPAMLAPLGAGLRLVTQLRALGVRVVIDEYVGAIDNKLIDKDAIDLVKLDRRLVRGIHDDRGRARAELVIGSITDSGIDVCAVGVETPQDLDAIHLAELVAAQG